MSFLYRARPTPFKCENEYLVLALGEKLQEKMPLTFLFPLPFLAVCVMALVQISTHFYSYGVVTTILSRLSALGLPLSLPKPRGKPHLWSGVMDLTGLMNRSSGNGNGAVLYDWWQRTCIMDQPISELNTPPITRDLMWYMASGKSPHRRNTARECFHLPVGLSPNSDKRNSPAGTVLSELVYRKLHISRIAERSDANRLHTRRF